MASKPSRPAAPHGEWKQQALELFEFSAEYYAASREAEIGFQFQRAIVLDMLVEARGSVLDIGCAAGSVIAPLRQRGFTVTGMDFSPGMLGFAQQRFARDPHVRLLQGDVERLPFASASFDHVVCLGVLEYLPDYTASLTEIARVLRPGGLAIFSIPNRLSPYYVLDRCTDRWIRPPLRRLLARRRSATGVVPVHQRNLCVPPRFRRQLRAHGLEPVSSRYSSYFVFLVDRYWPRLQQHLQRWLEPLADVPLLAWTGCQFLISARKTGGQA
jgi:ubiquinone/menaquinone biosynthesis C-methylase UbiE